MVAATVVGAEFSEYIFIIIIIIVILFSENENSKTMKAHRT